MSTFKVTLEQIEVLPHPNADKLELAKVGEYRAVIPKDRYKNGDWAIYIPEQAVLPADLITELGLDGKLAGANKDRVKAVRLRGELSQGIVCRPVAVASQWIEYYGDPEVWNGPDPAWEQMDFSGLLGITKWVPPISTQMAGKVYPATELVPWPDVENIKRYPDMFTGNESVVVTEKIHGTCCLITVVRYYDDDHSIHVSSKGMGGRNLALEESETNLYWRAVKKYKILEKVLAHNIGDYYRTAIFGEVYGQGVQDLHYGVTDGNGPAFAAFDIWAQRTPQDEGRFLDAEIALDILTQMDIPIVPILYSGPYDYEKLNAMASGMTTYGEGHIREGIVIRPFVEAKYDETGSRRIGKMVSEEYLTRKGDVTEYE